MRQVVAHKEVKNNEKSINRQPENVVAVAYKRWSFMRGSNSEKTWCFGYSCRWSLMGGGHTWRFDCSFKKLRCSI